MTLVTQDKSRLRRDSFARRKDAVGAIDPRPALEHLQNYVNPHRGKPMSGYMAIRTEIDPMQVMVNMAKDGPVGVPVIEGDGLPLTFRRWNPNEPMLEGPFGAMVPIETDIVIPQILIVPLVAFDGRGYRLGYGGGFYDRSLEQLRKKGNVLAIGLAFSTQEVDEVPTEPTDQPLDAIATDTGLRIFRD